jgi:hypothetical protein
MDVHQGAKVKGKGNEEDERRRKEKSFGDGGLAEIKTEDRAAVRFSSFVRLRDTPYRRKKKI